MVMDIRTPKTILCTLVFGMVTTPFKIKKRVTAATAMTRFAYLFHLLHARI